MVVDEKTQIYLGSRIKDYVSALKELGYTPDQVSKILVTHKHADHTSELRSFPNAKIYISRIEADDMKLDTPNIIRTDFTDGPYKNFERSQKIADGVHYIFAPGHTKGNSIIIVEDGGLHYIIHGDVTYTDEALYADRLSVVFDMKVLSENPSAIGFRSPINPNGSFISASAAPSTMTDQTSFDNKLK